MRKTREQAIVEEIRAKLGALRKEDTSRYKSGGSKRCNTTTNGL